MFYVYFRNQQSVLYQNERCTTLIPTSQLKIKEKGERKKRFAAIRYASKLSPYLNKKTNRTVTEHLTSKHRPRQTLVSELFVFSSKSPELFADSYAQ